MYTNVTATPLSPVTDVSLNLYCTPTPTFIGQVARIFATSAAGSALLLEGPPGIGKTAVVKQIAKILGYTVERINFSSSTTMDQLIGTIIPCCIDGHRVVYLSQFCTL